MECCSAIKRNEVGTHATTWINLENITLMTKARHIVYDSIYMKHPEKANPQKKQIHRDRKQINDCHGLQESGGCMGRGFPLGVMKVVMRVAHCKCTKCH